MDYILKPLDRRTSRPAASDTQHNDDHLKEDALMDARGRTIAWVIRDVSRLFTASGQKELSPLGVTMAHWYYLRVLESGPMTQLELAKGVGMATATAVPVIDFLEKNDLVKRSKHPQDRRKNFVALTAKGKSLINEIMVLFTDVLKEATDGLSHQELSVLLKTLLKLEANLNAVVEGARDAIESVRDDAV